MFESHLDQAFLRMWCGIHSGSLLAHLVKDEPVAHVPQIAKATVSPIPKQPRPRGLAKEVGDVADLFLSTILGSEYEKEHDSVRLAGVMDHAQGVRHLENLDFHLVHEIAERMGGHARYYLVDDANEQVSINWPVDIAQAVYKPEGEEFDIRPNTPGFFLSRFASVSAKDVRGLVRIVTPKIGLLSRGIVHLDKSPWVAESDICGIVNGRWQNIEKEVIFTKHTGAVDGSTHVFGRTFTKENQESVANNAMMMMASVLTARYSWHVAFGKEPGSRVVLPTNPRGCLELFRSRERGVNGRRSALRHWVNEHYRNRSDDVTQLDYVREHLRGHTRFSWRGLDCELMVSEFDLEKNEFFRKQAAEWRSARKHNNVRVRLKAMK